MKKAVFTIEEYDGANNAGPKAKEDIDYFLKKQGFEIIHQKFNVHSKLAKLKDAYFTVPKLFANQNFDELYFQYPTYSSFLMKRLVKRMREKTNKLYFIVHDVESLRLFQGDKDYWIGERALFNATDGLIVHNRVMKKWLADNGVSVPMVELGIFDYKNSHELNQALHYNRSVCFAGNLQKSDFLKKIELDDSKLELFGANPSSSYNSGVHYNGQMSPDELPKKLVQDFGLVWDGNKINICSGKFGNYMRYNNPHKVSLYLSCGLPVIIWSKAALAPFISENKLGLVVDTLENLDQVLNDLSIDEYLTYKKNVLKMAQKLRDGSFITSAVQKIENI